MGLLDKDFDFDTKDIIESKCKKYLHNVDGIRLCKDQNDVKSNYAYFPIVVEDYKYTRDRIYERLKTEGIVARKYFYPLTNMFDCYKNLETAGGEKTPIAKYIADRVLTLPLYADLCEDDIKKICDIILGKNN